MNARVDFSSVSMARHALTVDLYYRMAETGILPPDARVELIEGEVVDMVPIGPPHAGYVELIGRHIRNAIPQEIADQTVLRTQQPLRLSKLSEPQPDIAVVRGSYQEFVIRHPEASDVDLVIEVADSSRTFDRDIKAKLYAAHQIAEYWVVDLTAMSIERRTEASSDGYLTLDRFGRSDLCQSVSLPWLSMCLAKLT